MNNQPLPRRDLREPAFRKYELYIARACSQSIIIDPQAELTFTPSTFIARFRDAILAKKRYNYPSSLIPPSFDISKLEAAEIPNGRVLIKNKTEDKPFVEEAHGITEADVVRLMNQIATKEKLTYDLVVSGGEELGKVLAWAAKHEEIDCLVIAQNGKAFFYTL